MSTIEKVGSTEAIFLPSMNEGVSNGSLLETQDEVLAIEDGVVISIIPFTGEIANSPWWNNTYSIFVKHKDYILNYGELIPVEDLKSGDVIEAGQVIGNIRTVLLKDKGRPMAMLHLEMYTTGAIEPLKEWPLNTDKPSVLLDPTELVRTLVN